MLFLPRSLPVGARAWLLLTAACTTVHPVRPTELSSPNPLTRVWLTRADHTTVVFDSAHVSGDSLIGIVDGQPKRLRLSEATVLRVREPAPERTAGLVFFGVTGAAALVLHFVLPHGPVPCLLRSGCCPAGGAGCPEG